MNGQTSPVQKWSYTGVLAGTASGVSDFCLLKENINYQRKEAPRSSILWLRSCAQVTPIIPAGSALFTARDASLPHSPYRKAKHFFFLPHSCLVWLELVCGKMHTQRSGKMCSSQCTHILSHISSQCCHLSGNSMRQIRKVTWLLGASVYSSAKWGSGTISISVSSQLSQVPEPSSTSSRLGAVSLSHNLGKENQLIKEIKEHFKWLFCCCFIIENQQALQPRPGILERFPSFLLFPKGAVVLPDPSLSQEGLSRSTGICSQLGPHLLSLALMAHRVFYIFSGFGAITPNRTSNFPWEPKGKRRYYLQIIVHVWYYKLGGRYLMDWLVCVI